MQLIVRTLRGLTTLDLCRRCRGSASGSTSLVLGDGERTSRFSVQRTEVWPRHVEARCGACWRLLEDADHVRPGDVPAMQPRLSQRELMALNWPEDACVLTPDDLCDYFQPKPGRKHLWDWLGTMFDRSDAEQLRCHDQFLYVLWDVVLQHVDKRDKSTVTISYLPTPVDPATRQTKVCYSVGEVAAWWNEALRRVGYLVPE